MANIEREFALSEAIAIKNQILPQLRQFYIFGCRLDLALEGRIFEWLRRASGHGFCYECSALLMIALRDNFFARIIRGQALAASGEYVEHSWLELELQEKPITIDPCWIESKKNFAKEELYLASSTQYYRIVKPKVERIHSYSEFWSYALSRELYDLCRDQQISQYSSLLLSAYREDESYGTINFHHEINSLASNLSAQKYFIDGQLRNGIWPETLQHVMEVFKKTSSQLCEETPA